MIVLKIVMKNGYWIPKHSIPIIRVDNPTWKKNMDLALY